MAIMRATFTAYVDDGPTGDTVPFVLEWSNLASPLQIDTLTLPAATDVTLGVPVNTVAILLIPPPSNSVAWVVKGNAADVGTSARIEMPRVHTFGGGVVILRAVTQITPFTVVYF